MSQCPKARLMLADVDSTFVTKEKLLTEEAKAQAAADSNESDGFAKAMRKYVLSVAAAYLRPCREAKMMKPSQAELEVLLDAEALAEAAAAWLTGLARSREGRIAIALAGGSTPKRFYERLAAPRFRDAFPWSQTHWFWGDERFVPHDDRRSNFFMAQKALLAQAPIPQGNIHAIPTRGLTPRAAAEAYERELKSFYGADRLEASRPLFDAVLLGLGDNGHTASLMPGAPALDERRRWVVEVQNAAPETRITLTYPALESAYETAFLVAGVKKKEALTRLRADDASIPAGRLRPEGALRIFADVEATGTVLG